MIKNAIASLLVLALITCCGLVGCGGGDNPTLAVVGDYDISAEECNNYYDASRQNFNSAQEEFDQRRMWLDSLIVTRMLIQEAYSKGIDKLEQLATIELANRDKFLLDVLYQKKIATDSDPGQAEIRAQYDRFEFKLRASHILIEDEDSAQAIFERVRGGESFEELAYEYSKDPSAKRNKGDLGYFEWGAMVDEFQRAAFAMEPGEISPPVKSMYGYHIIKLIDRLPNEKRTSYESMESSLAGQLKRLEEGKRTMAYLEELKEKYVVRIDTSICDYVLHKREQLYPPMMLETLPRNDFDMEQLDRNERELVLGTWGGGQITLGDYLQLIRNISPNFKPDFDDYDSLATMIFELKKNDLLIVDAHRSGVDTDPRYVEKLKFFRELNMADIMRNDSIPLPLQPTDAMARQYYDDHPEEYQTVAKVHVYEIMLSDEEKAKKLAGEISSLGQFTQLAASLTERPGKRVAKGDLGFIQFNSHGRLFTEAQKTPIGSMCGPVKIGKNYSLAWVVDRQDPAQKDYLGVKRQILQKLLGEQRNLAFQNWVAERKKEVKVVVNEDALWSLVDIESYDVADQSSM